MFSLTISRIPALLKISTEKITVKRLKNDIKQLNQKLSELQALLETREAEILRLSRYTFSLLIIIHIVLSTRMFCGHMLL